MNKSIKLRSACQIELAREFAGIVGESARVEGSFLVFDVADLEDLKHVAKDAEDHYRRVKKTVLRKAADTLREKLTALEIYLKQQS